MESIFAVAPAADGRQSVVVARNAAHRLAELRYVHDDLFAVHLLNRLPTYGGVLRHLAPDGLVVVFDDVASFVDLMAACPPCKTVIVVDSAHLKVSSVSSESVMKQQFLRFVAAHHRCTLVSVSQLDAVLGDVAQLSQLVRNSGLSTIPIDVAPEPVFKFAPDAGATCLFIPPGWDSWSKIEFLAKSVYYDVESADFRLLEHDSDLQTLSTLYAAADAAAIVAFFCPAYKPAPAPKQKAPLPAYSDIMERIEAAIAR